MKRKILSVLICLPLLAQEMDRSTFVTTVKYISVPVTVLNKDEIGRAHV